MSEHACETPIHAEDYEVWKCPTCAKRWRANEDDGWSTIGPDPTGGDPFAGDLLWACCIPAQTGRPHADNCTAPGEDR